MAQIDLTLQEVRKMQLKGLDMAKFFDKFCRENNLTYFLCGGCCIGAVRNKGFIPWDDDVDVHMPREDYEKLKKLWKDTEEYSIQYTTKDYLTQNAFLTICANNTTFIKTYQKDLDINHGLVLDVIPLDGCPQGVARKMQKFWGLLYLLFIVGKAPENNGKLAYMVGKVALGIIRSKNLRYKLWSFCEKRMSHYPFSQCKYVTEICAGPYYMKKEYPVEAFSAQKYVPFEDTLLPIPVGYDTYLSMAFGNYMELPPVEKRVCHHEFEVMDMEHSYRIYRGTRYFVNQGDNK